jgi:hypothetical protein
VPLPWIRKSSWYGLSTIGCTLFLHVFGGGVKVGPVVGLIIVLVQKERGRRIGLGCGVPVVFLGEINLALVPFCWGYRRLFEYTCCLVTVVYPLD